MSLPIFPCDSTLTKMPSDTVPAFDVLQGGSRNLYEWLPNLLYRTEICEPNS